MRTFVAQCSATKRPTGDHMKRTLLVLIGCTLFTAFCLAQTEDDYRNWMKNIVAPTAGSLRKNIEAKNGPGAAQDAEKLAQTFEQVHAFWEKNNTADAVNFAKTAHDSAMQVAAAAKAGNWDEAGAGVKTLT